MLSSAYFSRIWDFSYQRDARQAFGWYLSFVLICILVCVIKGAVFPSTGFDAGVGRGAADAILFVSACAFLLLKARNKNLPNVALAMSGVFLSVFAGSLGGLIPLAVLSMRPAYTIQREI